MPENVGKRKVFLTISGGIEIKHYAKMASKCVN